MESRILGFGIRISAHGIRNSTNDWYSESSSTDKESESIIQKKSSISFCYANAKRRYSFMNISNSFSFFLLVLLAKGATTVCRSKIAFVFGFAGYLAATTSATAFFVFSLFNIREI